MFMNKVFLLLDPRQSLHQMSTRYSVDAVKKYFHVLLTLCFVQIEVCSGSDDCLSAICKTSLDMVLLQSSWKK